MLEKPVIKAKVKAPTKLKDPGRFFYKVAVLETLKRGKRAEIEMLLQDARDLQGEFGDFNGMISKLQSAAKAAK